MSNVLKVKFNPNYNITKQIRIFRSITIMYGTDNIPPNILKISYLTMDMGISRNIP